MVPFSTFSSVTNVDGAKTALYDYALLWQGNNGEVQDSWKTEKIGETESNYNQMLQDSTMSIWKHGGFWIGKYEAGFTETPTSSNYQQTTRTAVIRKDVYPYNCITIADAEAKSKSLATNAGGRGCLPYGVHWGLIMKYLKVYGGMTDSMLTSDSTSWGNYYSSSVTIESSSAKYLKTTPYTWQNKSGTKAANTDYLLSTGAAESRNGRMNIVDLAGNVSEVTLSTNRSSDLQALRGTHFYQEDASKCYAARLEWMAGLTQKHYSRGFRPIMYCSCH